MRIKRFLLVVLCVCALTVAVGAVAQQPNSVRALPPKLKLAPAEAAIPYTGRLADDAEHPVVDGAYTFVFSLYGAEIGGEPLWSEVQDEVRVQDGVFSLFLGNAEPLPQPALEGGALWLAVAVRGPSEKEFTDLNPRQRLSALAQSTAPAPSAGAACAHDHFEEEWEASSVNKTYGLMVENTRSNGQGLVGIVWSGSDAMGVRGWSYDGYGVRGIGVAKVGVEGFSTAGTGVSGVSESREGVHGETSAEGWAGVAGINTTTTGSGVGVRGEARTSSGSGVVAYNATTAGTALEIAQGAIKVKNAGEGTNTPVFIHKVATWPPNNLCTSQNYATVIDHPLTNGNPSAILIVTPNYGPNNAGHAPALGGYGVYYDATNQCGHGAGRWVIYNYEATALNEGQLFNVLVVVP